VRSRRIWHGMKSGDAVCPERGKSVELRLIPLIRGGRVGANLGLSPLRLSAALAAINPSRVSAVTAADRPLSEHQFR
jgi:hypothetical protein